MNRSTSSSRPVRPTASQAAEHSPSGLFTRADWRAEIAGRTTDRQVGGTPVWARPGADAEFSRWVHARAKTLATDLDRLAKPGLAAPLARHLAAVSETLWADADWARRRLDEVPSADAEADEVLTDAA